MSRYDHLDKAESREGFVGAGEQINALRTQAPELGTQFVFTVSGAQRGVQLVATGQPLSLLLDADGERVAPLAPDSGAGEGEGANASLDDGRGGGHLAPLQPVLGSLFERTFAVPDGGAVDANAAADASGSALAPLLMAVDSTASVYPIRHATPRLRSEWLPPPSPEYELRLVDHVDFGATVLADRLRTRVAVQRREQDVFARTHARESEADIWADLSVAEVAGRANDLLHGIADANAREFRLRLLERFRGAVEASGAELPDDEELEQQLDLVMVRNPGLLHAARKRVRQDSLDLRAVRLPGQLEADQPLPAAQRNLYGVFPPGLNADEQAVARLLDGHQLVQWWHRNSVRRPDSVGLYGWDDGDGFFPDFVVAIEGRATPDGVVLLEVKGSQLWAAGKEPDKAEAQHPDYGKVHMVGRARGEREFVHLCKRDGKLQTDGPLGIDRLRW